MYNLIGQIYKLSLFYFNSVPEEQLTEFVESKDHMIILNVLKQFQEKEDLILLALYSLHSLAGPCKCIITTIGVVGQLQSFISSHSVFLKNTYYNLVLYQDSAKESHSTSVMICRWLLASGEAKQRLNKRQMPRMRVELQREIVMYFLIKCFLKISKY